MTRPPKLLVFDSGLGGLTVFAEIIKLRPGADYVYCADDAGFPYGSWKEPDLVARVMGVMEALIADHAPDMVVIACNTASTLVLPHLRDALAADSLRRHGAGDQAGGGALAHAADFGARHAGNGRARLYAKSHRPIRRPLPRDARRLARRWRAWPRPECMAAASCDEDIAAEITPCFVEADGRRTDAIVLACTHYPLLRRGLRRLAPWPVGLDRSRAGHRAAGRSIAARARLRGAVHGNGTGARRFHQRRRRPTRNCARRWRASGWWRAEAFYFCGLSVSVSRKATMASMSFSDRRGFWPGLRS